MALMGRRAGTVKDSVRLFFVFLIFAEIVGLFCRLAGSETNKIIASRETSPFTNFDLGGFYRPKQHHQQLSGSR
jgi:hypothetical protein